MNIVIYSENGTSELADLINIDDETEIREFKTSEIEDYKQYNPSVIILDMETEKIREFCAIRKLECCVLAPVNEIPESLIIRALSYDYIKKPINKTELNVRINKGILEVENLGGKHDYRPGWWPINVIPTSYHQIEFDFYKNTPIYIKPNNIINQEMREKNYEEDPSGRYSCLPFYKDFNLYSYKDGKWQIDNNEEIISEIKNLLNLHKDEYFTFQRNNSWSRLYSGINDNEDINYSYFDDNKYLQFTFYKKPVVLFSDDKSNEEYVQTYRFVFNGTKYVLSD